MSELVLRPFVRVSLALFYLWKQYTFRISAKKKIHSKTLREHELEAQVTGYYREVDTSMKKKKQENARILD